MTLLERIVNVFYPKPAPAVIVEREARAVGPVVVPTQYQEAGFLNRPIQELSPEQQRSAYISITAMLIDYRARILSKWMLKAPIQREGAKGLVDVSPSNAWYRLLRRPNKHTPPILTYKWLFQNLDISGVADFIIETRMIAGRSVPVALHPLYPSFARAYPNYDAVGGVVSWDVMLSDGRISRLLATDIFRIRRPHPVDLYRNASLVSWGAYEIDGLSAQNVFSRDIARDQGKPQVMLEAEKNLNKDQLLQAGRDFAAMYRVGGTGAVPVSHNGLKIVPTTIAPKDLQFLEEKEFTREQLFTLAGVPIQLFNGEAYATGANSHRRGFMENTIEPELTETIEQTNFNCRLIFKPNKDSTTHVGVPDVIPKDREQLLRLDKMRLETGTPLNNILKDRGEEEVEGGDVSLVPAGLVPVTTIGESLI